MDAIKILILAIFQGIGEFLPISSSGHLLVLGKILLGDAKSIDDGDMLTLNILLHAGTLISILIYFHRQIWDALTKNRRTLWLVCVGSIPTAAIAVVVLKCAKFLTESLPTAGFGFIATGILLLSLMRQKRKSAQEEYLENAEKLEKLDDPDEAEEGSLVSLEEEEKDRKTLETMNWRDALLIGVAQGIAVLPGVSRSGSTISTGVLLKIKRDAAATFSFLLSIPVIGGGALLETIDIVKDYKEAGKELDIFGDPQLSLYALGALVSCVVGLVSLTFLMRWLKAGKIHYFAYWLFALGPIVLIYALYELLCAAPAL